MYPKDEATNFNADVPNDNSCKYFEDKAIFFGNTETDGANRNWRNATIAVPLKYSSNFWKSLGMSLINFKMKFKYK